MHRKSIYLLLLAVAVLAVLGIVMLSSTGAFTKESLKSGDPNFLVKRQVLWFGIGLLVCAGGALTNYHFWQRTWWMWFGLAAVLLALCFVPPIGKVINGSARWLDLRVMTFQPSEVAKLATVAFLAHWLTRQAAATHQFVKGFVIPIAAVSVLMALIALEVDLGTTVLLGATTFLLMFIAGTSLFYLVPLTLTGLGGLFFITIRMQERLGRLLAFLDLERYKEGAGLQQYQALIAFGSGGVEGLGLGNGRQKLWYLPFAHTDFIFPMIGEELGLRATLIVVFCYLLIVVCGTVIALHARDRFGMLFGFGLVALIGLQAVVNIGVTTALLPNKGMPLPFISQGGSNLIFCLLAVGILINIYRQGVTQNAAETTVSRLQAKVTPRI